MAPATISRREQQERTREALLDAAADVFERSGFHGAKLEDVAAEAGVTTGAVYSNFSGKEDLFLALADRQIERRLEMIRAVAEAGAPAVVDAAVEDQYEAFFGEAAGFPLLFHEFWSYGARNPALREEFASRRDAILDAIAQAVTAAADARGLRLTMPAESIAAAIRATMNGLAFDRAIDGEKLPMEAIGWTLGSLIRASVEPAEVS